MGVKSKIQTLLRVYFSFGPLELARLALRKIHSVRSETGNIFIPARVQIKKHSELTDEFYSLLLMVSEEDIRLARNEFKIYQSRFSKQTSTPRKSFFNSIYDLGLGMSEFVFLSVLIKKPQFVMETGVAAGVSTNSILSALQINGVGRLLSLDITDKVGELVDDSVKNIWQLKVLPDFAREKSLVHILKTNNNVRIFLHDSDHSSSWQIKEFSHVVRWLEEIELILFDDISQELIDFILSNHPIFRIVVIDENTKYSAIITK